MQIRAVRGLLAGLAMLFLLLGSAPARGGDDPPSESSSKKPKKDASKSDVPDTRVDANAIAAGTTDQTDVTDVTYIPMTSGDRLLQLSPYSRRFQLFYSASLDGAYDSHLAGTVASKGEGLFAANPTIGFLARAGRSQFVAQYSTTISDITNSPIGTTAYHQGNIMGRGEFNSHWGWDLGVNGWYGVDELRLLMPLTFTNLLNIPTANAQAAISQLGAQKTLNVGDNAGLHWQPTERDRVAFSAYHSYYEFQSLGSHITYVGVNSSYSHSLSRLTTVRVYGNFGRDSQLQPCEYFSGGLGINLRPRPNLMLDFSGGPAIGTNTCSTRRGGNFNASMGYQITARSTVYVTGAEQNNTPVNLPTSQTNRWFSAGYSRKMTRNISFRLDGGYMYLASYANNGYVRAQGYFVSPQIQLQLTPSLTAEMAYRNMSQLAGAASLTRNQALLTLTWRPEQHGLYK